MQKAEVITLTILSYLLSGDVSSFYLCHCTRCQKSTGSAHASNAFIKNSSLEWLSGEIKIKEYKISNTHFSKNFCIECGSPLPIKVADGKLICVPAGSLIDFDDFNPTAHIFMKNRKKWEDKLIEAIKYDDLPTN